MLTPIREAQIDLVGLTKIILHADNFEWADEMDAWQKKPGNKGLSKAGDDRTPPWRWVGCLHHNDGVIALPVENVMRSIMGGATEIIAKGKTTFKSQSQSGITCSATHWPLLIKGKPIPMVSLDKFKALKTFPEQVAAVRDLGFELLVRPVNVNGKRHIRVRPQFYNWSVRGTVQITDPTITTPVLTQILEIAGIKKGLGDWRPGAPKSPGPHGMFTAKVTEIEAARAA